MTKIKKLLIILLIFIGFVIGGGLLFYLAQLLPVLKICYCFIILILAIYEILSGIADFIKGA